MWVCRRHFFHICLCLFWVGHVGGVVSCLWSCRLSLCLSFWKVWLCIGSLFLCRWIWTSVCRSWIGCHGCDFRVWVWEWYRVRNCWRVGFVVWCVVLFVCWMSWVGKCCCDYVKIELLIEHYINWTSIITITVINKGCAWPVYFLFLITNLRNGMDHPKVKTDVSEFHTTVVACSVSWPVSADFLGVSLVHNAVEHKDNINSQLHATVITSLIISISSACFGR